MIEQHCCRTCYCRTCFCIKKQAVQLLLHSDVFSSRKCVRAEAVPAEEVASAVVTPCVWYDTHQKSQFESITQSKLILKFKKIEPVVYLLHE